MLRLRRRTYFGGSELPPGRAIPVVPPTARLAGASSASMLGRHCHPVEVTDAGAARDGTHLRVQSRPPGRASTTHRRANGPPMRGSVGTTLLLSMLLLVIVAATYPLWRSPLLSWQPRLSRYLPAPPWGSSSGVCTVRVIGHDAAITFTGPQAFNGCEGAVNGGGVRLQYGTVAQGAAVVCRSSVLGDDVVVTDTGHHDYGATFCHDIGRYEQAIALARHGQEVSHSTSLSSPRFLGCCLVTGSGRRHD